MASLMVRTLCAFIIVLIHLDATAQTKRLYIANDDHTDYMWTADEAKYDSAFVQMLDYYLQQIDSTRNLPSDYQARFNCDGHIWLQAYQRYRSPQQFQRLVAAIKSGHISVPLNALVSCYGAQPTEAVIRGMYAAGTLESSQGLRFTMAGAMENNTLPLGLASLWAGSGAKYSWKGIGGYGSQMSYLMRAVRKYPMYNYRGLDGSGVLMKWYAYNEKTIAPMGGYAECRMQIKYKDLKMDLLDVVNTLDRYSDSINYNVAGAFGFGHDDLQTLVSAPFIDAARNATNAQRRVRVSNEEDFFRDFEKTYPKLPAQSVSYGNEWDLLPVSMQETTAKMRRATEKLRSAEAMAAVVSLRDKTGMRGLEAMRTKAWDSYGKYYEHNWTADGPVSRKARAEWQMRLQGELTDYVDSLYNRSLRKLGEGINGDAQTFFVFNPLGWVRSDAADVPYISNGPIQVVDKATGKPVLHQMITKNGKSYLRIWADSLPSVGYKLFSIRSGFGGKMLQFVRTEGAIIENNAYRLQLSKSGAISSWTDKQNGRQFVAQTDAKRLNDLGTTDVEDGEPLAIENDGPVSITLKAVSNNPVRHTVRITLYAKGSRIDIKDSIQQNFDDVKGWSFGFDLANPVTRHEELGAILTVKKASHGGHYADENARYNYQTFNHFANVSNDSFGVTLSNLDCSFFKLGGSTFDSLWEGSSMVTALAGGNVDKKVEDGGTLGILNQNGNKHFSYAFALTSHQGRFDPTAAFQFSLEHQTPLVTGRVRGLGKIPSPPRYSLLAVSHPSVLLWSVKPAEDGQALAMRFWNTSIKPVEASVSMHGGVERVWKTTHIETVEKILNPIQGRLHLPMGAHAIHTYRVQLKSRN